jgi:hypothetical protein
MTMISEETKAKELSRLVTEFDLGERQNRNEAWNLIAEFAYDNAEEICEALSLRTSPPPSGEAGEVDLRTLVPGFRLDWSGLRNRFDEDLCRFEKLTTYEMRAAHLDEMARQFEDAINAALEAKP